MASNNVPLGELIHQVGERNKELLSTDPLGVSIDKEFMPSVANTIGTDLSKYMLLRRNRFACNPMHVGRDRALPIARYKKDVPGIVSPAYMTFEADEDRVDLDYLELFFKLAVFDKECWFYTDSSVRGGLSWDALCSIELNLPSFDEQRKIAAITKVIRGRMAQLAEQNDYLSQLIGLFRQEAATNGTRRLLKDVTRMEYGFTQSASEDAIGPKFLRITDMVTGAIDWSTVPYCDIADDKLEKYLLKAGDIVVARTGASAGSAAMIGYDAPKSVFASFLVRVNPLEESMKSYIGATLVSKEFFGFVQSNASGSAQPQANPPLLGQFEIMIPCEEGMASFNRRVEPLLRLKSSIAEEKMHLTELRDALLPRLMSGKIDVSKVDITQLNNHFL